MQLKTYTGPLLLAWPNLSRDPFALQYRDIVQNLLKDLIWQKRIWGQVNTIHKLAWPS